jgi:hypothetical protein
MQHSSVIDNEWSGSDIHEQSWLAKSVSHIVYILEFLEQLRSVRIVALVGMQLERNAFESLSDFKAGAVAARFQPRVVIGRLELLLVPLKQYTVFRGQQHLHKRKIALKLTNFSENMPIKSTMAENSLLRRSLIACK